jgi:glycosyltransferase involved in cell wall biosynthesis
VGDDGSGDEASVTANQRINQLSGCRFIAFEENRGAAAMRNLLARMASYEWLLFLDCDMQLPDDQYVERFLQAPDASLVNGGIRIARQEGELQHNLRYMYESRHEAEHTAEERQKKPYQSFRSTNFMVQRSLMLRCPFDESFRKSGYEDVALGRSLSFAVVDLLNIDNPLVMTKFENNAAYMDKIDRSMHTLSEHRDTLRGYSGLLSLVEGMPRWMGLVVGTVHKRLGHLLRRNLAGTHPCLRLFNAYRVGLLATLIHGE